MASMGSTETKQKTADFHHPVSPEILQAVIDTGGVTDASIIPHLKDLSPLEMRINLTIQKYKRAYCDFNEARKRAGNKRIRKKAADTVAKAERILTDWLPWLSADGLTPGSVSSLITRGKWSKWLSRWPTQMGRPSESILAGCAEELVKVFKQSGYRKPPWGQIGEAIAVMIPEAHFSDKSDLGHWIFQIVKRHRKHKAYVRALQKELYNKPSHEESSPTRPTR
jgi:hypothetical protein